jgi:hypothetical protein
MASKFVEDTVDALNAALIDGTTGINAQIDDINTELTDLELDYIKTIYPQPMFVMGIGEFPAIVIWPDDSPGDEDTNNYNQVHNVSIWIIVSEESDQANLYRRIWRYQRAITQAVRNTHNLNGEVDICFFKGHRYDSPWYGLTENGYLSAGGCRFEIHKEERIS